MAKQITAQKPNVKSTLLLLLLVVFCTVISYSQETAPAPYALFHAGKYREAITEAQILIEQDSENISAYAVVGWSHINLRQWKQALDIAKKGEAKKRLDSRFTQIIGEAYYELKQYDNAKEYFGRYLQMAPRGQLRSWVYYYLGNIYVAEDKHYKAEIAYSTAVYLDEEKVSWWLSLASVYELLSKAEQAKEVYRKVLALDTNNRIAKQKLQQLSHS